MLRLIPLILIAASALPLRAQTFEIVSAGAVSTDIGDASGASWVDFDADGDADLFVSNRNTSNALYRNDGGSFTKLSAGALTSVSSTGNCWADYDNDGDLDAALAGNPSRLMRNEGGSFTNATTALLPTGTDFRGWACAWGDYDLDGALDLFVTHPTGFVGSPSQNNFLFRNLGNGTFERITGVAPTEGLAPFTVGTWNDFDGDGDFDLFVGAGPANGTTIPDYIYRNLLQETGTADFERFTDAPFNIAADGQVWNWIDYDNDGDLDAFRTNYWGGFSAGMRDTQFENDEGTYRIVTTGPLVTENGYSLAQVWADFDNDADLDVFVVRDNFPVGASNRVFTNEGGGVFTSTSLGPVTRSWGGAGADYDGDGDVDLFLPTLFGQSTQPANVLYRNTLDNGNHWLRVRLEGGASNRDGIGAVVETVILEGGETEIRQRRDVSSQNTFNGSNELTVHFGLGQAEVVESLTVTWPSGTVDVLTAVSADQTVSVVEGSTATALASLDETPAALEIWPNPAASGVATVRFRLDAPGRGDVRVFDVLGREVSSGVTGFWEAGPAEVEIGATGLSAGLYLIRVQTGSSTETTVWAVAR